jgi:hypothetical protein
MTTAVFLVGAPSLTEIGAPALIDAAASPCAERVELGVLGDSLAQPPATRAETNTATAKPETEKRAI